MRHLGGAGGMGFGAGAGIGAGGSGLGEGPGMGAGGMGSGFWNGWAKTEKGTITTENITIQQRTLRRMDHGTVRASAHIFS